MKLETLSQPAIFPHLPIRRTRSAVNVHLLVVQTLVAACILGVVEYAKEISPPSAPSALKRSLDSDLQKFISTLSEGDTFRQPLSREETEKLTAEIKILVRDFVKNTTVGMKIRLLYMYKTKQIRVLSALDLENIFREDSPEICLQTLHKLIDLLESAGKGNEKEVFELIIDLVNEPFYKKYGLYIDKNVVKENNERLIGLLKQWKYRQSK